MVHSCERSPRRVRLTRVAPVAIFLREDASWLIAQGVEIETDSAVLSHSGREVLEQLRVRGASFLRDLVGATG